MTKRTTAAEQQNQRTLEDHTQTVESTSVAWHYVVPPMIDSADQMSSVAAAKEVGKPDPLAEAAGDGPAMLVAVP